MYLNNEAQSQAPNIDCLTILQQQVHPSYPQRMLRGHHQGHLQLYQIQKGLHHQCYRRKQTY